MTYDDWYNNILPKDILYIKQGNYFIKTPIDNYGNHVLNNEANYIFPIGNHVLACSLCAENGA